MKLLSCGGGVVDIFCAPVSSGTASRSGAEGPAQAEGLPHHAWGGAAFLVAHASACSGGTPAAIRG